MATLTTLPSLAIIAGFYGKVDFYLYHPSCDPEAKGPGTVVARKWPRSPGHDRAAPVEATWPAFTYAAKEWSNLAPVVQNAYIAQAEGSALSGRDLFTRSYLKGLYRYSFP